jgi:predicted metal-dependent peptidase
MYNIGMEKEKIEFNLDRHIIQLLKDEPFFAAISRRINKTKTNLIPTAGVRVNPQTAQFEMLYNPEFFAKLTKLERLEVIKHEYYHLLFEHVTGRKPQEVTNKIWNFATDLAINSHLENLPENCLKPGQGPFADFEAGLSAEEYLRLLQKMAKDEKEKDEDSKSSDVGEDGLPEEGQFDSHEDWDSGEQTAEQQQANKIAEERLKEYVKEAVKEIQNKGNGWGSISQSMQKEILTKIQTKINWRNMLRYFVKASRRANQRSTVKRLNKRYRYIHPGKKVERVANIAISIDQSGSVSDEMLVLFFGELSKLAKLATFTVVPFDHTVDATQVYEWKKGTSHKAQRVKYGGTDFDAPTDYVNRHNFDAHIILTDLMAPKPKASKCKRMWMTTNYYAQHPYFETREPVIAID